MDKTGWGALLKAGWQKSVQQSRSISTKEEKPSNALTDRNAQAKRKAKCISNDQCEEILFQDFKKTQLWTASVIKSSAGSLDV